MDQESDEPTDVDPEVEAIQARIETALRAPLEEQWEEVLDQWSDAAPSDRAAVRTDVSELRNRVLDHLLAIESHEVLNRDLAVAYIEVKCRWMGLNTRIQQQTTQERRPEETLVYRATCVSLIVQALEPFLEWEQVDGLVERLTESLC